MDITTFVVISILILINALYVAAEFAAVSVRRSRIQEEAENGNPLARRLLPILSDPKYLDRYVAACQIGITLSSLVLGAYGQAKLGFALSPLFESLGGLQVAAAQSASAVIILIMLTALQMVLGELVPKSLALEFPTQVSMWTLFPMEWSLRLYSVFIKVLNGSGHWLLKIFGMGTLHHQHIHSAEEIKLLIAESRDGGLLEPDEHRRLSRALEIGVRPVVDLMVPKSRIQALNVEAPLEEVTRAFSEKPFTRLPVYEKNVDSIIGVVHARDVALSTILPNQRFSLRNFIRPTLVVSERTTAEGLLVKMREAKRQIAVVVNNQGKTIGLVGIADVLDEFLGDVVERSPGSGPQPERLSNGTIRLPATLKLTDAVAWIGKKWTGKTETIGGKIVEEIGYLPAPGERFNVQGVIVEIERSSRRAIESVIIHPKREKGGR